MISIDIEHYKERFKQFTARKELLFALPILFIFLVFLLFIGDDEGTIRLQEATAEKRTFTIGLSERGVIEASRFVQVKSKIQSNNAQIVELIPEGSHVRKNTIIARLDSKPFMDDVYKWEAKVKEITAAYVTAQKEIEIHKNKILDEIEATENQIEIARINLKNIQKGDGKIQKDELEVALFQEKREATLKEEELKDYQSLFEKGYISKRELDKVANDYTIAKEDVTAAERKLENYITYEWPKAIKESSIDLQDKIDRLANMKIRMQSELDYKEAELIKTENLKKHHEKMYQNAMNDIANCNIFAPIDGVVLYNRIPKSGGRAKVDIGDKVWHNHSFLQIPDTSKMILRTNIREIDLRYVRKGQKATIKLDAYPDKTFEGIISYIDTVAKSQRDNQNIKFFETIITISNEDELLRSGMSATVRIEYDTIKDQLTVPVSAINYEKGKTFVLMDDSETPEKRPVVLGAFGKEYVVIKEGLEEDESVYIK